MKNDGNQNHTELDVNKLSAGQISNGIANTENYHIFTTLIDEFHSMGDKDDVEWKGSFAQICPAKNMFVDSGKLILPDIYIYLKNFQQVEG